jgi:hypothetical protein
LQRQADAAGKSADRERDGQGRGEHHQWVRPAARAALDALALYIRAVGRFGERSCAALGVEERLVLLPSAPLAERSAKLQAAWEKPAAQVADARAEPPLVRK